MKKNIILTALLMVLLLTGLAITSCSEKDQMTGKAVQASLLQVKVVDEKGELVTDTDIYLNNIHRGRTSKYGESKGTKLVILDGTSNWISAEKEGYFSTKPTSVSAASVGGDQKITLVLEKERTSFLILVLDENEHQLPRALVTLHEQKKSITLHEQKEFSPLQKVLTDDEGLARLEKVEDGIYFIKVKLKGYEEAVLDEQDVSFEDDGVRNGIEVRLKRLPHLDLEIVDDNSRPLSSAEVTLYTQEDFNHPGRSPLHISYTNTEGEISYNDVNLNEKYVLIIKREGFTAQTIELALDEENQYFKISLSPLEE